MRRDRSKKMTRAGLIVSLCWVLASLFYAQTPDTPPPDPIARHYSENSLGLDMDERLGPFGVYLAVGDCRTIVAQVVEIANESPFTRGHPPEVKLKLLEVLDGKRPPAEFVVRFAGRGTGTDVPLSGEESALHLSHPVMAPQGGEKLLLCVERYDGEWVSGFVARWFYSQEAVAEAKATTARRRADQLAWEREQAEKKRADKADDQRRIKQADLRALVEASTDIIVAVPGAKSSGGGGTWFGDLYVEKVLKGSMSSKKYDSERPKLRIRTEYEKRVASDRKHARLFFLKRTTQTLTNGRVLERVIPTDPETGILLAESRLVWEVGRLVGW